MAMIDQDAHASAPQEQTSLSVRYRYQVQLPDGRLLSGEIAEQEVPEGVRGACKVPQRHATLAVILARVDRLTQGPKVHQVLLTPMASEAEAQD